MKVLHSLAARSGFPASAVADGGRGTWLRAGCQTATVSWFRGDDDWCPAPRLPALAPSPRPSDDSGGVQVENVERSLEGRWLRYLTAAIRRAGLYEYACSSWEAAPRKPPISGASFYLCLACRGGTNGQGVAGVSVDEAARNRGP